MRKLDLIVGVVGGFVLIGALAGAYMEGSTGVTEPGSFAIVWESKKTPFDPVRAQEATFNVSDVNLTSVHFEGKVTAGAGYVSQGDKVTLTVTAPNGTAVTKEGTLSTMSPTVTLAVDILLNKVPDVSTVEAPSGEAALRNLAAEHQRTLGTGDWTVTLTVTRALNGIGAPVYELSGFSTSYAAALKDPAASPIVK